MQKVTYGSEGSISLLRGFDGTVTSQSDQRYQQILQLLNPPEKQEYAVESVNEDTLHDIGPCNTEVTTYKVTCLLTGEQAYFEMWSESSSVCIEEEEKGLQPIQMDQVSFGFHEQF